MESITIVWLDQSKAKIYHLARKKMERKEISDGSPNDPETKLFTRIQENLLDASKILVTGPDATKDAFYTYLIQNQPILSKKLIGCESLDQASDIKIADIALRYFRLPKTG